MLVLTRRLGEGLIIGDNIKIAVEKISKSQIKMEGKNDDDIYGNDYSGIDYNRRVRSKVQVDDLDDDVVPTPKVDKVKVEPKEPMRKKKKRASVSSNEDEYTNCDMFPNHVTDSIKVL